MAEERKRMVNVVRAEWLGKVAPLFLAIISRDYLLESEKYRTFGAEITLIS